MMLAIPTRWYTLPEAIDKLRERRKFDHWSFQASFNLNIDPRLEGHDLAGAVDLPHGLMGDHGHGRRRRHVLALTRDPDLAQQALDVGAHRAGDLLHDLRTRAVPLNRECDVIVACTDMKKALAARKGSSRTGVPRILSKFSLTPAVETKTLVPPENFVDAVAHYVHYITVQYRADLHGNVTVPLGKVLLPTTHLVENCHAWLREFYNRRPVDFGTGPRGRPKNRGKYVLGVMLKLTEGRALPVDLSTVAACEHYGRGPPPYYTPSGMPFAVSFREPPPQTTATTTTTTATTIEEEDEGEGTTVATAAAAAAITESPPPQPRVPVLPNGHPVEPIVIRKRSEQLRR